MEAPYNHNLAALLGDKIGSFLMDCSFPGGAKVNSLLRDLATQLLAFQEEGEALIPQLLFISEGVDERAIFASSSAYELGTLPFSGDSAKMVLKVTARLASEHTLIYVRVCDSLRFSYGILNHGQGVSQPPPARAILPENSEDALYGLHVAMVSPTKSGQLRIITPRETLRFALKGNPVSDDANVDRFTARLAESLSNRGAVAHLIAQSLGRCSRAGHGCIALMATKELELKIFEKRVDLTPALDLSSVCQTSEAGERACEVLAGMLSTDLATIISESGKVLAFNAHIPSGNPSAKIVGGARTQAWHAARDLKGLVAGLIVSQDGGSQVWDGNNE